MSVYNSNIQTRIVDPVFDRESFRTEFRLGGTNALYLSNMRLINMGIETTADNQYIPLLGAWCMKSIHIYDGNKLLDQLLESTIYKAFQNFNNTNDKSMSSETQLDRTSWNFMVNNETADLTGNRFDPTDLTIVKVFDNAAIDKAAGQGYNSSWLSLKGLLPFLSSSLYVPTTVFTNLRIVIEWKNPNELKDCVVDRATVENNYKGTALVVDEVVGGSGRDLALKNYQGVVFRAVEVDSVNVNSQIPPAGQSKTQDNRFLVNGFNNKTVERMLVVQTPLDSTSWINGNTTVGNSNVGSQAQLNNEFQFRVNGQNVLPRTGYTKKNQRLAALTDTYGECCLIPMGNYSYVPRLEDFLDEIDPFVLGSTDYTAVEIRRPVRELVVEYNRTNVEGIDNGAINQALRLNLFGEVVKSIRVDNGSYVISYL